MEHFLEVFIEHSFISLCNSYTYLFIFIYISIYIYLYTLKVNLYTKSKYPFLSGSTGVFESFLQRERIKSKCLTSLVG